MNKIVKILAIVVVLSLIATIGIADRPMSNKDQEREDRDKVLSEEVEEKPPINEERHNVEDTYAVSNSARELKIEQLHDARKQGNEELARSIIEELELSKDFPSDKISQEGIEEPKVIYYDENEEVVISPAWTTDILVTGSSYRETNPVMTVDQRNGIMYVAVENWKAFGDIDIYKSTDGGNAWYKRMTIEDASQPSITVARDTLLIAFVKDWTNLFVYHEKDGIGKFALVDHNNNGFSGPDITSDAAEYANWHSYVAYNIFDGINYHLRLGISTDSSETYSIQTPFNYGSSFIPNAPSIDYGGTRLYVAHERLWNIGDRDTYVMFSTDDGFSFNTHCSGCTSDDEYEPSIAATKSVGTAKMVLTAYTRTRGDKDVYYEYSSNDGGWNGGCLFCSGTDEKASDLATDFVGGKIHAAIWKNYDIKYTSADYTNPSSWSSAITVNENNWASTTYPRPSVASNFKRSTDKAAVIVWTDYRNDNHDIYFDSVGNVLSTFVRGNDNGLWYRQYDGATWGSWTSLGGIITSDPDAVSYNGNRYVFIRGTDNGLWYRRYDGTWSNWISLGGIINSAPGVAEANGKLFVFARGTDNALWYRTFDSTSSSPWGPWLSLGGVINSGPGAMRLGTPTNLLYVFTRGTDNALWYRTYNGNSWSGWTSLGGITSYDPDATALGGKIYVFSRGNDGVLWYRSSDGTSWGSWTSLGGIIKSSPGTATFTNDAYIFAQGADNALWYRTLTGTWQSLGGIIDSGPGVTN